LRRKLAEDAVDDLDVELRIAIVRVETERLDIGRARVKDPSQAEERGPSIVERDRADLPRRGIDPTAVEWSGLERQLGADIGLGLQRGKEKIRLKRAAVDTRAVRGRAST